MSRNYYDPGVYGSYSGNSYNYNNHGWYAEQNSLNYSGSAVQYNNPESYQYTQQQQASSQYHYQTFSNHNKRRYERNSFIKPVQYHDPHYKANNQTTSPEPKRLLQGNYETPQKKSNNTHVNIYNASHAAAQHAAYQTPNTKLPFSKQNNHAKSMQAFKSRLPANLIKDQRTKEWEEHFSNAIKFLNGCRAGEEINILLTYLQPTRLHWNKTKEEIQNDLLKVISSLGVEKTVVFGSTLTGIDFFGSDLDYYVQLKNPPKNEDDIKRVLYRTAKSSQSTQDFQVFAIIPNARVPIIRLFHFKTKTICDVNFTSKFGYYNSFFIGNILNYDKRIKGLAIILKLWSKACKISQQMIMSNYCLIMCMIFYLQNLQNPMLDTIFNNQKSRSSMVLDEKYRWNFYFNNNINKAHKNDASLRDLLIGFFQFYSKLDYTENIVSIYTGETIKRTEFESHPALEEYRQIITFNGLPALKTDAAYTFAIQDGFELNVNIGIKSKKHADMFFEFIRLSLQKCEEMKDKPFSELLTRLLTDVNTNLERKQQRNKKKFSMTIHAIAGDLKICQDILTCTNPNKVLSSIDQQKFFYEHAVEYTKKFLQEIYLCTVIPEISEANNSSNILSTRFKIFLQYDTINGRKKLSFKDDVALKVEQALSAKMLDKKVPLDLDILLEISSKDMGKTIDYDMFDYNYSKKSPLLSFANFFSINIATAIRYYLRTRLNVLQMNT